MNDKALSISAPPPEVPSIEAGPQQANFQDAIADKIDQLHKTNSLSTYTVVSTASLMEQAIQSVGMRGGIDNYRGLAASEGLNAGDALIKQATDILQGKLTKDIPQLKSVGFTHAGDALVKRGETISNYLAIDDQQVFSTLFPGKDYSKKGEVTPEEILSKARESLLQQKKMDPAFDPKDEASLALGEKLFESSLGKQFVPPLTPSREEQTQHLQDKLGTIDKLDVVVAAAKVQRADFMKQSTLIASIEKKSLEIAAALGKSPSGDFFRPGQSGTLAKGFVYKGGISRDFESSFNLLDKLECENGLAPGSLKTQYLETLEGLLPDQSLTPKELMARHAELAHLFPQAKNISEVALCKLMDKEHLVFADLESMPRNLAELLNHKAPGAAKWAERAENWIESSKPLLKVAGYGLALSCFSAAAGCHFVAWLLSGGEEKYLGRMAGALSEYGRVLQHPAEKLWQRLKYGKEGAKDLDIQAYIATGLGSAYTKKQYDGKSIDEKLALCKKVGNMFDKIGKNIVFDPNKEHPGFTTLTREYADHGFVGKKIAQLNGAKEHLQKAVEEVKPKTDGNEATAAKVEAAYTTATTNELSPQELYTYVQKRMEFLESPQGNIQLDPVKVSEIKKDMDLTAHFTTQPGAANSVINPPTAQAAVEAHVRVLAERVRALGGPPMPTAKELKIEAEVSTKTTEVAATTPATEGVTGTVKGAT